MLFPTFSVAPASTVFSPSVLTASPPDTVNNVTQVFSSTQSEEPATNAQLDAPTVTQSPSNASSVLTQPKPLTSPEPPVLTVTFSDVSAATTMTNVLSVRILTSNPTQMESVSSAQELSATSARKLESAQSTESAQVTTNSPTLLVPDASTVILLIVSFALTMMSVNSVEDP